MKPIDRSRKPLREHNAEFVAAEVVENLQAQLSVKDQRIRTLSNALDEAKLYVTDAPTRERMARLVGQ